MQLREDGQEGECEGNLMQERMDKKESVRGI